MVERTTGKPKGVDKDPKPTLVGQTFKIGRDLKFTVEADTFYPEGKHDKQNGDYLDNVLKEGEIASVFYHAIATPLVRVKGGALRLKRIRINNEVIEGSFNISARLNLLDTRQAVGLDEA